MHYQLGLLPQTRTQETFREKFLGTSKAFAKMKLCCLVQSSLAHLSPKERCVLLLTFLRKKVREGGLERSSNISRKIKKHGNAVLFVCIISWGFRPNPDQRTFREKSFGNPKVFDKMKWCCLVQSSLAHLSAKERCVLLLTFLSKKSKPYRVFL